MAAAVESVQALGESVAYQMQNGKVPERKVGSLTALFKWQATQTLKQVGGINVKRIECRAESI